MSEKYCLEYLRKIAKICHQANKALCESMGDNSQVDWEEVSLETRRSAIDGVIFHLDNDTTPEESHNNWMEFKKKNGWSYGEVKDEENKIHPCMVDYYDLPVEQREKDVLFKAIVDSFKVDLPDKPRDI